MMVFDVRSVRPSWQSLDSHAGRKWPFIMPSHIPSSLSRALTGPGERNRQRIRHQPPTKKGKTAQHSARRTQTSTHFPSRRAAVPPSACFPRICHDIAIPACHVFLARRRAVWGKTLTHYHLTMLLRSAHALPWLPLMLGLAFCLAWPPDPFAASGQKKTENSLGCC